MATFIGQEFGGYRILSQVGKGGMATVYKAFQASLDRYVAVKVMPPFYAQEDETFLKRFQREARAVAKLRHPNILMVIDFGEHDGFTYIVMEYVDAGTLTDRLGSPLPLDDITTIIDQIASALDYAHGQGVVHRDVKPSNILLPKPNWPLLTDFGLAKIVGGSQLTITGSIAGTPAYMSPEQGQGESVDSRSDIYSLGIVLYEMATGGVPYHAETPMAVVVKHIIEPLPLPRSKNSDLPEAVERVILKALAKKPEDRYQRVVDLSNALMKACEPKAAPTIIQETLAKEKIIKERKEVVEREIALEKEPHSAPPEPLPERVPQPPPISTELPPPSGVKGLLTGRKWLRVAIPIGLVVGFFCMLGFSALVLSNLKDVGPGPTETVVVDEKTADEHIQQGYAFYEAGNYQEAVVEFESAIALGSEDVEMHFDLADTYFYELGMRDKAIGTIERVSQIAPDDPYVIETVGLFFQEFGLHEEAIGHFERALEMNPEATYLYLDMADSYEALGDLAKAEELRLMSGSEQKDEDPSALEERAREELDSGNYQAAVELFSRAVELDQGLLSAWDGLADAYWSLGDTKSAINALVDALTVNEAVPWMYEKLGHLYWDAGEYDYAIQSYEYAIELDPEWSYAYHSLADLYYELGDLQPALESFQRALEANPDRIDIVERIGYTYLDVGNIEMAISSFERAVEQDPAYGWNHYGLAEAYLGAGRYEEAVAALGNAAPDGTDDAWLADSIGWLYVDLNRCDLGLRYFEMAVELDPSLEDANGGIDFCSE